MSPTAKSFTFLPACATREMTSWPNSSPTVILWPVPGPCRYTATSVPQMLAYRF